MANPRYAQLLRPRADLSRIPLHSAFSCSAKAFATTSTASPLRWRCITYGHGIHRTPPSSTGFGSFNQWIQTRSSVRPFGRRASPSQLDPSYEARAPPEPSTETRIAQENHSIPLPDDMGLLPDTFMAVPSEKLPNLLPSFSLSLPRATQLGAQLRSPGALISSLWQGTRNSLYHVIRSPSLRLRYLYKLSRHRFFDALSLIAYAGISRPRLKFRELFGRKPRRKIEAAALALHESVYHALARGDLSYLREVCCQGIMEDFTKRVYRRGGGGTTRAGANVGVEFRWNRSHVSDVRLLSHRGAGVPEPELLTRGRSGGGFKTGLRQAVVWIDSQQSLERWEVPVEERRKGLGAKRKLVEGTGGKRRVAEGIVLQKIVREGSDGATMKDGGPVRREGPWRVWGFVEAATLEDALGLKDEAGNRA